MKLLWRCKLLGQSVVLMLFVCGWTAGRQTRFVWFRLHSARLQSSTSLPCGPRSVSLSFTRHWTLATKNSISPGNPAGNGNCSGISSSFLLMWTIEYLSLQQCKQLLINTCEPPLLFCFCFIYDFAFFVLTCTCWWMNIYIFYKHHMCKQSGLSSFGGTCIVYCPGRLADLVRSCDVVIPMLPETPTESL